MVWTSKWSCSSWRKQMTFMVAWSIPVDRFGVLLGFNLFKDFSCGLWLWKRSQKRKHPSSPEKNKLHMWLFPIWFITQLLNKSCFHKPPPPWSPTLQGYPKISPLKTSEVTYTWELLPQHRVVSSLVHSSELKSQSRQQTPRPEVVVPALCSLSW